jgi:hypothetical protein
MAPHLFQTGSIGIRPFGVRLKQIIADIGARNVDIGPDVV